MKRIVRKKVAVTKKGQTVEFNIVLPKNAKNIKAIWVMNTVDSTVFVPASPYTPTPITTTPFPENGMSEIVDWFYAITSGTGYAKWDRLRRTTTNVYSGGVLVSSVVAWYNLTQDASLATAPDLDNLALHTEDETIYHELVGNDSFVLTNVEVAYPFGLTGLPTYRYVLIVAEANSTATTTEKERICRFGLGTDLVSGTGAPLSNNGRVILSKSEFENLSMIGLQALNHTIQIHYIN